MKYIRTKDGIFTQENYEKTKVLVGILQKEQAKIMPIERTDFDIIAQADTIEDLCDVFIGVLTLEDGHICHIWYNDEYLGITEWDSYEEYMEKIWEYTKANQSLDEIIYGTIWTEWGLKYVAKMNDKGELELL